MTIDEDSIKLIQQIQAEQNPAKLYALVTELTRKLDTKRASAKSFPEGNNTADPARKAG